MRIDEFSLSSFVDKVFKRKDSEKEDVKPKEDGGVPKEKTPSEKMLDIINKDADKTDYKNVLDSMKYMHKDKFDEKLISDFKNAKWFLLYTGDDGIEEFLEYVPVRPFKSIKTEDGRTNYTDFYRFSLSGENNDMDITCIHFWDYGISDATGDDYYDEEDANEYENDIFIGINSTKANN